MLPGSGLPRQATDHGGQAEGVAWQSRVGRYLYGPSPFAQAALSKALRASLGRLRGLAMSLPWGEFLTVFGPNGSRQDNPTSQGVERDHNARPDSGEPCRLAGLLRPQATGDVSRLVRRNIGVVICISPFCTIDLTSRRATFRAGFTAVMFGLNIDLEFESPVEQAPYMAGALRPQSLSQGGHTLARAAGIASIVLPAPSCTYPPILLLDRARELGWTRRRWRC